MKWHIQYRKDKADCVEQYPSPETAIAAACVLMDNGCDVYGIGTGEFTDSIAEDQIARIYALWTAAKCPKGKFHTDVRPAAMPHIPKENIPV